MVATSPAHGGSGQERMFDLNRPQGFAKDDYLYQWASATSTIFNIIGKNNNQQSTRDITMAVMFAIPLIAHDDIRRKQEILFHAAIDHINNGTLSANNDLIKKDLIEIISDPSISNDEKVIRISRIFKNKEMTASQKTEEILRICAITMGNLTAYVDQFRGLAHTLKVGELVNLDKPYAKRQNAFPLPDDGKPMEI
jgi:hypothetical protein